MIKVFFTWVKNIIKGLCSPLDRIIIPEYGGNIDDEYPIIMESLSTLCRAALSLEAALEKSPYHFLMFTYPKTKQVR